MRNKALDARLLSAEEPSVRPPVPVQPELQALIPPPERARCTHVPLLSTWGRRGSARPCVRARVCSSSLL